MFDQCSRFLFCASIQQIIQQIIKYLVIYNIILYINMGWFFNSDKEKKDQQTRKQLSENRNNNNFEIHENVRSYSSSKSCRSDPQDPQYLICKQKINEGGNIKVRQTRVHSSQSQFGVSPFMFSNFFKGIQETSGILQQRLSQLEKDLPSDIDRMFGSFLPFFMTINPQILNSPEYRKFQKYNQPQNSNSSSNYNHYNRQGYHNNGHRRQQERNNYKSNNGNNYYFTSNQKDYQIKDL